MNGSVFLRRGLALASVLLAGAALSGCNVSASPEPQPSNSTEYVTPTLEEELAQKLQQNRLNPEDLKIVVANYENIEAAANAWWDTFNDNCVTYGNPRLSYENELMLVATTGAGLDKEVFERFKLAENHAVCRSAMMVDNPDTSLYMDAIGNLNSVFVANQLLGNSPRLEAGPLSIDSITDTEVIGTVTIAITSEKEAVVTESTGFWFTVSEDGTLLWNKRP